MLGRLALPLDGGAGRQLSADKIFSVLYSYAYTIERWKLSRVQQGFYYNATTGSFVQPYISRLAISIVNGMGAACVA